MPALSAVVTYLQFSIQACFSSLRQYTESALDFIQIGLRSAEL